MSKTNIYVLRLEGGRYYIGKSNTVMNRYEEHLNGRGSAWTRKYKPISLEKILKNVSPFDEDKVTKEYMCKYGIDKVRGGSYVEIYLTADQTKMIHNEIKGATDACQNCGESGHFIRYCPTKKKSHTIHVKSVDSSKPVSIKTCYTCGNVGHYSNECEKGEESHEEEENDCVWGCEYCDRIFTTAFGCGVHERSCKEKNTKKSYIKENIVKKESVSIKTCYRCGKNGHHVYTCYATRHIKGYLLD